MDSVPTFPPLFHTIDSSRTLAFAGVEFTFLDVSVAAVKVEGVLANKQGISLVWVSLSLFGDTTAP